MRGGAPGRVRYEVWVVFFRSVCSGSIFLLTTPVSFAPRRCCPIVFHDCCSFAFGIALLSPDLKFNLLPDDDDRYDNYLSPYSRSSSCMPKTVAFLSNLFVVEPSRVQTV